MELCLLPDFDELPVLSRLKSFGLISCDKFDCSMLFKSSEINAL